jgi:hypothetical protein
MKGKFELETKFDNLTPENCFISEMTLAELKFGVTFSGVRIAATPFLYTDFLTPYFGFNVGAAYNFKTETAFDGKAK